MKNNDVELIHRILAGDDAAFENLVNKYRKQVHSLAWRKIGDFHIAEEITQDTFLKAYQSLSTLKNPNQFSGWLYIKKNGQIFYICPTKIERSTYKTHTAILPVPRLHHA